MLYFAIINLELVESFHNAHAFVGPGGSECRAQHTDIPQSDILVGTGSEESQPPLTSLLSHPLNPNVLSAAGAVAGAASEVAELRKHMHCR